MKTKHNIGMFDQDRSRYVAFNGPRMAKPTPYNTDGNPEAYRQFLLLSAANPSIVLRRIPDNDLKRLKAGGLG